MDWLRRLLGTTRPRERTRREVDEELRVHLELRQRQLRERGLSPSEARAEAERKLGGLERARRRLYVSARRRDRRVGLRQRLDSLRQDLRLAARRLRAEPGGALFTVAVLALGIGLTTATFTLVEGVLLRPLPFPEPDRLVSLRSVNENGFAFPYVSSTNWYDWRDDNRTLEATALHGFPRRLTVATADGPFRVDGVAVGGRFFDVLRMPLVLGRGMTEAEIEAREPLAVVSEVLWRDVLGGDPDLDRELTIDGRSRRIVGVVAAGAGYPEGVDVWVGAMYRRMSGGARNNVSWMGVGRLRPGVSVDAARADLSAIADRIRAEEPEGIYSWGVGVVPLRQELVDEADDTLWLLLGAASTVLLIACANIAGLGLARGTARQGETAVRLALGASRLRVVQQQVVEQVVLAVLGGLLGLGLASWLVRSLVAGVDGPLPRAVDTGPGAPVLLFALGISVLAGLLSSLLPALRASRPGLRTAMGPGRGSVGGARTLPGALLVGAEVALAVVLLVGGGLLVRSWTTLVDRDLGFDPTGVVTADVALAAPGYHGELRTRSAYWDRLLGELSAMPEVESVGLVSAPPTGDGANGFIEIEGSDAQGIGAHYYVASEGYFETLGIPVLAGRAFDAGDDADSPRVTVVSRAMAELYWPGESPLGRRLRASSMEGDVGAPWLTVVGVVGDVRHRGFADEPRPQMYVHHRQVPQRTPAMTAVIATRGTDPGPAMAATRQRITALDAAIAPDMDTLEARLQDLLTERRLVLSTLSTFATLAVGLASVGLYGLLSFAVVRRRREIAVRAALGATGRRLLALVLRDALRVVAAGLAAGLGAAWWLGELLRSMLVGVGARDPATYFGVAAALLVVGLAAALVPAWRAAHQHPAQVLRIG